MPSNDLPATTDGLPGYIRRYLAGESVQKLAAESNVAVRTLYNWMLSDLGDQYQEVVTQALINRIADADVELQRADDQVQIARAREQARFARMDLERRRPSLYGQRPTVAVNASGDGVTIQVVSYSQQPDSKALQQSIDDANE